MLAANHALVERVALSVPLALLTAISLSLARRAWRQRSLYKIPGPRQQNFLIGNLKQFLGPDSLSFQDDMARAYGRVLRLNGLFGDQLLVVSDPTALQHIVNKHADIFQPARYWLETVRMYFGRGLLSVTGETHRRQRRLMHPAFSPGNMKRMVPLFHAVARELRDVFAADAAKSPTNELDVLEYMCRGSLESIAQAGFGHTFNALHSGVSEFGDAIRRLAPAGAKTAMYRPLLPFLTRIFSPAFLRRVALAWPWPALHEQIDISDTFDRHARAIWQEKQVLYAQGDSRVLDADGRGRNILTILLNENSKAAEKNKLPDNELLGQIIAFLFAGTDTSSNGLARILHNLALHKDVQDALRRELQEVLANASKPDCDADVLDHLPLLDAVVRETLRLHPPIRFLQRVAGADHILPLLRPQPDVDGAPCSEIFVPAGTTVLVNIAALNRDPGIWGSDAGEWKPARWLAPSPLLETRMPGVFGNIMSFSGGPRSCVGYKFSLLQMKAVLFHFITSFEFAPSKRRIDWRFGGIVTPAPEGGVLGTPELPLRVSRIL
ncbi:cytochrome P450 [Peniophora sp. CONT]|nr:cytochrome P450 [Peniophora sp. CONT]